ncbi:phosphotransferase [Nocardiopsis coralliicola]
MSGPEITADLVRDLLRNQHPDLADLPLRAVAGGWGNQMWRLGEHLAVRMPRTPEAPALLRKEHRWLPLLAPRLPLAVPEPVRIGQPSQRFPQSWTVMTWVPGVPLDSAPLRRGRHAAQALAGFLTALHTPAPADAPVSDDRGGHPRDYAEGFDHFFRQAVPEHLAGRVRAVWDDAAAAPAWRGPPLWVHGDLHPANAVGVQGTLSGVIDFGDLLAGDPAWDLAAAWVVLPAGAAAPFFDAYGRADAAAIRRARGLAALKSLFLLLMGRNGDLGLPGGKPAWGPAGAAALDRVLNEEIPVAGRR